MVIQVNGKLRGKMQIAADADRDSCEAAAQGQRSTAALPRRRPDQESHRRARKTGQFRCLGLPPQAGHQRC